MNFSEYLHLAEAAQILFIGDEDFGNEQLSSYRDQAWTLANNRLRILAGMDLHSVAVEQGRVVGALFTGLRGNIYSFDIVADPKAGQVLSLRLIQAGIEDFNNLEGSGIEMELNVVEPRLVPILQRRFGFEVAGQRGNSTLMRPAS